MPSMPLHAIAGLHRVLRELPDCMQLRGLKSDLRKLDALYSALPEEALKEGLINFAAHSPEDVSLHCYYGGRTDFFLLPSIPSNQSERAGAMFSRPRWQQRDFLFHLAG
jgi:hypothetical protein